MFATLFLLQVASAQTVATGQSYEGTGRPAVAIPRIAADVTVDGSLTEPAWGQAARLTGFQQYQPADGRPAEERTEGRVFYSQDAIYFGILAYAKNPASIRATIADRDNLDNDDRITIYLDTFNDKRRAFFFVVNPLGAQGDGMRTEGAASAGNIFGGNVDWNPDFRFESKGQVTDSGYVIEVRIPFKSLRFPTSEPQTWGVNVVRNVKATGFEDTWTDARRATASFLSEAGTLTGIRDIERGITTEVQPFVTARWDGARGVSGDFERDDLNPDAGVNLKVALPSVTLDATVKPDFSQVESDAGLVTVNERFALFFAEKRPFFLEGIELFNTPNQLVYTRQIASPVGGAKVTGKLGAFTVAYLSALDDTPCPKIIGDVTDFEQDCDKALFNIARLRRDFGGNSTAALTITDRRAGDTTNTVVAGDVRYVFGRMYYFESQVGASWTKDVFVFGDSDMKVAPIWKAEFDRTGRSWGFNYQLNGISDEFVSRSGFLPRNGTIQARGFNRLSYYGKPGARLENITVFFGPERIWLYDSFSLPDAYEGSESVNAMLRLRGGWNVSANVGRNFFTFDPRAYSALWVVGPGQLQPYLPPDDQLSGLMEVSLSVNTPTFRRFNGSMTLARNQVPIFAEGSEGRELRATGSLTLRPTVSTRAEGSLQVAHIDRALDGSEYARTVIPRLKVEYQPTRALFFRVVSQYQSQRTSALRAPTGESIFFPNGEPVPGFQIGALQTDWLVSYEPTPGTVAFFGYGDTRETPGTSSFSDLERRRDGFFVKVAYQWRR
ncbi:MAG: hypothetical protein K0S86_3783 [Geminicoccaceae bacterium]|nr:hypothetical protein [Geminicoccaceae bacterium]